MRYGRVEQNRVIYPKADEEHIGKNRVKQMCPECGVHFKRAEELWQEGYFATYIFRRCLCGQTYYTTH